MLASLGSLLLGSLLRERDRDRDREFVLHRDSFGDLDLDLDLDDPDSEDLDLVGLVFTVLVVEGDLSLDEDVLRFLRGLSFARIDWQRLSKISESGGSPRVTLVVNDFSTAQRNSSRLWVSLARSTACVSFLLSESDLMMARARSAALFMGFPPTMSKINGWSQKDWAFPQS
jgi:hypothetical protein